MSLFKIVFALLGALAVAACKPAPAPSATDVADGPSAAVDTVPFRARIVFEPQPDLVAGARLAAYVVEANFEDGERRLVAEKIVPVTGESSPVLIEIDVPRTELNPDYGYIMHAAIVDDAGQSLLTTATNRAPVPATGLYFESIFNIRLLPVATAAAPDEVFRLSGELALDCGGLEIVVRQHADGRVDLSLPDTELQLAPAVATAGGRFSDGARELWLTDDEQAFLLLPGEPPRNCVR